MSVFPEIKSLSEIVEEEKKPTEVAPAEAKAPTEKVEISALGKVAVEKPEEFKLTLTPEEIETIKKIGKTISGIFKKAKEYIETKEQRKAESEIAKLEKEIEKLQLLKEKAEKLGELEKMKEKLKKQLEETKTKELKQTV